MGSRYPALGGSAFVRLPDPSSIGVVGWITPEIVAAVRGALAGKRAINTLYVDSNGGDVSSALQLARLLRDENMRLVVAGRCFSACANYLFSAAPRKEVLSGSLVGIHDKRFNLWDKEAKTSAAQNLDQNAMMRQANAVQRVELAQILEDERRFYRDVAVSRSHNQAFEDYVQARKKRGRGACPELDVWILTKRELDDMRVHGVGAAWFPASTAEAQQTAARLGLMPNRIFFGSLSQFMKLCPTSRPSGWLSRFFGQG